MATLKETIGVAVLNRAKGVLVEDLAKQLAVDVLSDLGFAVDGASPIKEKRPRGRKPKAQAQAEAASNGEAQAAPPPPAEAPNTGAKPTAGTNLF